MNGKNMVKKNLLDAILYVVTTSVNNLLFLINSVSTTIKKLLLKRHRIHDVDLSHNESSDM